MSFTAHGVGKHGTTPLKYAEYVEHLSQEFGKPLEKDASPETESPHPRLQVDSQPGFQDATLMLLQSHGDDVDGCSARLSSQFFGA